jgi:hypothetical protein
MKRRFFIAIGVIGTLLIIIATVAAYQNANACKPFQRPVESLSAIPHCYQAASAAQAYYHHLVANDFARAAEYVAYYETFSDLPPATPSTQLEQIWTQRVRQLREQGFSITQVNNISVTTDDGYPIGVASVTISENGQERIITQQIRFANLDGWKVQSVDSSGEANALDSALSGHIDPTIQRTPAGSE